MKSGEDPASMWMCKSPPERTSPELCGCESLCTSLLGKVQGLIPETDAFI